jgi:hypothetical protein
MVEQNETAGAAAANFKQPDTFPRDDQRRKPGPALIIPLRSQRPSEQIHGSLGHNNSHDGFTETSAGNASRFVIRVATAAD